MVTERLKIIGTVANGLTGFFSVVKIARETGLSKSDVRAVLDRLFREGLLVRFKTDPKYATLRGRPPAKILYQKKDAKKFAKRVAPKLKEGTAQDRMWSVIRNKSEMDGYFKVRDIIILAGVGRENARWFVKALRRAGIVRNVGYRDWVLIKDVGPRRPYVGGKQ